MSKPHTAFKPQTVTRASTRDTYEIGDLEDLHVEVITLKANPKVLIAVDIVRRELTRDPIRLSIRGYELLALRDLFTQLIDTTELT